MLQASRWKTAQLEQRMFKQQLHFLTFNFLQSKTSGTVKHPKSWDIQQMSDWLEWPAYECSLRNRRACSRTACATWTLRFQAHWDGLRVLLKRKNVLKPGHVNIRWQMTLSTLSKPCHLLSTLPWLEQRRTCPLETKGNQHIPVETKGKYDFKNHILWFKSFHPKKHNVNT